MFATLFADMRYALRGLLARPLLGLVIVLSIGLGVGLNTSIFSLYQQVILRSLPVPDPQQLVILSAPGPRHANLSSMDMAGEQEQTFSYPMFRDLESDATLRDVFVGVAGHRSMQAHIAYRGQAHSGSGVLVSGNYFSVLQLQPALGRLLQPVDDQEAGAPVVVLAHDYWRNRLNANPGVLGSVLTVNGQELAIVGVAPEGFSGVSPGIDPDFFVSLAQRWALQPNGPSDRYDRGSYWIYAIARLAPGVGADQAAALATAKLRAWLADIELPLQVSLNDGQKSRFLAREMVLLPAAKGQSMLSAAVQSPLQMAFAATLLVLAVAGANVANLLLARNASRRAEFAVRLAIGAGRGHLIRQLLVESSLLAAIGALVAMVLVVAFRNMFAPVAGSAGFVPEAEWSSATYAGALALACMLVFALLPAWHGSRVSPSQAIRGASDGVVGGKFPMRFRTGLAIAQVSVSMVAMALAALFWHSMINLSRIDSGMAIDHVAVVTVAPERSGYSAEASAQLFAQIEVELAQLPGVLSAAASQVPLLSGAAWKTSVSIDASDGAEASRVVSWNAVGPAYFGALGVGLLAGRHFDENDVAQSPRVAVVNRAFAEKFALGDDPLNHRIMLGGAGDGEIEIEIVGLAQDSSYDNIKSEYPAQLFLPWRQRERLGQMSFYVRTVGDPQAILPQLAAVIARLAPNLPVDDLRTLPQQLASSLSSDRMIGHVALGFALLATGLAALGLYGMLNYSLSSRQREIGLRIALGAGPARIRRMLLQQLLLPAISGMVLGLIAALAMGRLAEAMLFGVRGNDPLTLVVALSVVAAVFVIAGWIPARRAARTDPMTALRYE
jgi:predicted permease